jgi:hypothetical protein
MPTAIRRTDFSSLKIAIRRTTRLSAEFIWNYSSPVFVRTGVPSLPPTCARSVQARTRLSESFFWVGALFHNQFNGGRVGQGSAGFFALDRVAFGNISSSRK